MNLKKSPSGFTLIELLLYISLSAIILFSVSFFLFFLLESRIKTQVMSEVEQQGLQIIQQMTQSIRNASAINSPAPGQESSELSLNLPTTELNPSLFKLSSGVIHWQEGEATALEMNDLPVTASNFAIYNLSQTNSPGSIHIEFTLNYNHEEGRKEYDYQKTFQASASLRPN